MLQKIPNFLARKPSRPVSSYSGWKDYKDKEIIFNSDQKIEHWDSHPKGIIFETDGALFISDENKIFLRERERERVRFHVARSSQRSFDKEGR